jgi:ABC-type polysaccharide/polyol phosphate transport system ATPase subunit
MKTRLAASVFINLKPDILICDEFLSAGDEKFQNKFENQMKIILKDIGIFILATHNQKTIKQYCTRVITLSHGEILSDERI